MSASNAIDVIDFTRYRRPELATHVGELLSVSGALLTVWRTTWKVVALSWIVLALAFHDTHSLLLIGAGLYGTLAAVLLGCTWGIWRVVQRTLGHIGELVQLLLELCAEITRDLEDVARGERAAPTRAEVMEGAHDVVLEPIVEATLRGSMWVLGRVLFWAYRRSLRRIVIRLVRELPDANTPIFGADDDMKDAHDAIERSVSAIEGVRGVADTVSKRAVRWVLAPLALVLCAITVVVTFPLGFAVLVSRGSEPPPTHEGTLRTETPLVDPTEDSKHCILRVEGRIATKTGELPERFTRVLLADGLMLESGEHALTVHTPSARELRHQVLASPPWPVDTDAEPDAWFVGALELPTEPTDLTVSQLPCGAQVTLHGERSGDTLILESPPDVLGAVVVGALLTWWLGTACLVATTCIIAFVFILVFGRLVWSLEQRIDDED